jgi:hypothetical protein
VRGTLAIAAGDDNEAREVAFSHVVIINGPSTTRWSASNAGNQGSSRRDPSSIAFCIGSARFLLLIHGKHIVVVCCG